MACIGNPRATPDFPLEQMTPMQLDITDRALVQFTYGLCKCVTFLAQLTLN